MMTMMTAALSAFFVLYQSLVGADDVVSTSCTTREGAAAGNDGSITSVTCSEGETMVSCGIKGTQNIGGARIVTSGDEDECQVLSHYATTEFPAYPEAVCCSFPDGAIADVLDIVSSAGTLVTASCPASSVLTGCHVYYESGSYNNIQGSFVGDPGTFVDITNGESASSLQSSDNQCSAGSKSSSTTVTAHARCIEFSSGYSLECTASTAYTTDDGLGSCSDGAEMYSCNTWTTSNTLDAYFRESDGDCFVLQDDHVQQWANAVCCQLYHDPLLSSGLYVIYVSPVYVNYLYVALAAIGCLLMANIYLCARKHITRKAGNGRVRYGNVKTFDVDSEADGLNN